MTQHIGLELVDERGNVLNRSQINFAQVISKLHNIDRFNKKYPLMSNIDEYGNTYFNILQVPDLRGELERFRDNLGDNLLQTVDKSISFLTNI